MNTKSALDDLIESCRRDCYRNDLTYGATVKLTQLREQLRVAREALEYYANAKEIYSMRGVNQLAQEALTATGGQQEVKTP